MDVELHQFDLQILRLEAKATFEEGCRQDQRVDRRRPLVRSGLDGPAVLAHQRGGRAVGDDLAVGEGLGSGDVIQVPVTENHPDAAGADLLERRANHAGMRDGDVRVVDDRLCAVDDGKAADAERERPVIDPVVDRR